MNMTAPKRAYRQSARAVAAEATAARILDAFTRQLHARWYDEIRLEEVARDAEVTVQTVIRRFGGKEGLLAAAYRRLGEEIMLRREVAEGDATGAVASIIDDYEAVGDLVMRTLAQEDRFPAIREVTDGGRRMHRLWIEAAFRPWLDLLRAQERRRALDALVVAGDIYVWKLIRRDMGRPVTEYRTVMETMFAAAIGLSPERLFDNAVQGEGR